MNLIDFNKAMIGADGKVLCIMYYNDKCQAAEVAFNRIKLEYPSVVFYKVETVKAPDIKNKYADGASKPYFKFYKSIS